MVLINSSLVLAILLFEAGVEITHNCIQSTQVLLDVTHYDYDYDYDYDCSYFYRSTSLLS